MRYFAELAAMLLQAMPNAGVIITGSVAETADASSIVNAIALFGPETPQLYKPSGGARKCLRSAHAHQLAAKTVAALLEKGS